MTKSNFKKLYLLLLLCLMFIFVGCKINKKSLSPTTVTLWHVYGGQVDSPLNHLIDKFNQSVGQEENIRVEVTSVTNTNTIHEGVLAAAFHDPGAMELPDMFISYPKTVLAMPDEEILVNYKDYFSDEELAEYIPAFINEGIIHDRLVVFPIAKSTEILFVNKTAFDRFAKDTDTNLSDLATWEGLFSLAENYYQWTDAQTPEIPNDGKAFFAHDYHFNYFQVGVESLGENFFSTDKKSLRFGPNFKAIWQPYAKAALNGGIWLGRGYATEPLRTGDAIVSVASSASILYYSDIVTYLDNTSEQVQIIALPCPTFQAGEKLVMQRGAGICTVKSTAEKEKACITFLKWLTDAKNNVDFVTKLGYMPVKIKSMDYLPDAIKNMSDAKYISLYEAFIQTKKDYNLYTAPQSEDYLDLEMLFEDQIRAKLALARNDILNNNKDIEELIWNTFKNFKTSYMQTN